MKIKKVDNRLPLSIRSRRKMAYIAISVDGSSPMNLEFTPSNSISWPIENFVFYEELEFHVFGMRGGRIPDSDLEVDCMMIRWPER